MANNTTNCGCEASDIQGCAPLPVVERGTRAIAVGTNSCPVAVSGMGLLVQTSTGVYAADGSVAKPIELGTVATSPALNGILGTFTSGVSQYVRALTGQDSDAGKVVKFDGKNFVLRSLLESLCYPADVVATTCCPELGLAVWSSTGSSMCLQRWDPCQDTTNKAVLNPKFVACEDGGMVTFTLCNLPVLESGVTYRQVVCTDDGPRILGGNGVSARQFIPFDVLGAGTPILLPDSTNYDETDGANITGTFDIALITGVAIPVGTTHVQLLWTVSCENDDSGVSAFFRLYVPGSIGDANQRSFMEVSGEVRYEDSTSPAFTTPITTDGKVSWLLNKSGPSNEWDTRLFCRLEGYWVG